MPLSMGFGADAKADRPLAVWEAAALVRDVLAAALPARLRIVGEISNFSNRTHWFFSLKDEQATLRCVCFASAARRIGFVPADGMAVVATGRIDYYDAQGQLQLYVDQLEPVGQGALELQFRALCEQLRQLGYFDPQRKKPLPIMPRTIAVVTSRTGAALQDVINTARRRWPGCRLLLLDARMQGAAAAPQIAAALNALSKHGPRLGIDAIILTRGGGSIEDLWAFNERIVADAVYRCTLPVVAAIGHETDTTIAELVADVRCATPTQAAMTLVPDRRAIEHQLVQLRHRLTLLTRQHLAYARQRVAAAARHPALHRPDRMLQPVRLRLQNMAERLRRAVPQQLAQARRTIEALQRHLESVGPQNVLNRGYSYTLAPDGRVLRNAADVAPGDRIRTHLAHGRLTSTVANADTTNAAPSQPSSTPAHTAPPPSSRKRKTSPSDPGATLF